MGEALLPKLGQGGNSSLTLSGNWRSEGEERREQSVLLNRKRTERSQYGG